MELPILNYAAFSDCLQLHQTTDFSQMSMLFISRSKFFGASHFYPCWSLVFFYFHLCQRLLLTLLSLSQNQHPLQRYANGQSSESFDCPRVHCFGVELQSSQGCLDSGMFKSFLVHRCLENVFLRSETRLEQFHDLNSYYLSILYDFGGLSDSHQVKASLLHRLPPHRSPHLHQHFDPVSSLEATAVQSSFPKLKTVQEILQTIAAHLAYCS